MEVYVTSSDKEDAEDIIEEIAREEEEGVAPEHRGVKAKKKVKELKETLRAIIKELEEGRFLPPSA